MTAIEPGGQISFEEARAGLVTKLSTDKARAAYLDIQDQIEELRAAFQPLKQIADRFKIPLTTVTRRPPRAAELSAVPGLAEDARASDAAQAIFAGEVGKLRRDRHLRRQPQSLVRPHRGRSRPRPDAGRKSGRC